MNKIMLFLALIIASFSLVGHISMAQADQNGAMSNDLGIKNPGMLPSSPFYFLKEWQRSVARTLTSDPIKRVELELQYVNERAAEIKKMEEVAPKNSQAIAKAVNNYKDNVEQLKEQLQKIATTDLNSKVADTLIKHQELFDNLKNKFKSDSNLVSKLETGQQKINEIINTIQPAVNTTSTITTSTPAITTSTL